MTHRRLTSLLVLGFTALSCVGAIDTGSSGGGTANGDDGTPSGTRPVDPIDPTSAAVVPATGVRRLSIREYNNVVASLIYDTSRPFVLGDDAHTPFDNDATTNAQVPSTALVDTVEATATDAASRLVADKKRLAMLMSSVGCTPKSATDSACFTQFLTRFGRRALRRPLDPSEITKLMDAKIGVWAFAVEDSDFYSAVGAAVRALLQFPELMYRMEADTSRPVPGHPGVFQLVGWEVASRLSFLLWGEGPDDALLDRAQSGALDSADGIRAAAGAMLADPRAKATLSVLHAMWLNYDALLKNTSPLGKAMATQSGALVSKVIFEDRRPWQELLRSDSTYLSYPLAQHYKVTIPAGSMVSDKSPTRFEWLRWGPGRMGLLSEASFLGLAQATTEQQMVIRRGQYIRERLLCQTLPPKPAAVVPGATRPASPCKWDLMANHRTGSCASCHNMMDPIGFGLDGYDGTGAPRTVDRVDEFTRSKFPELKLGDPLPQCPVHREGELDGKTFNGPKMLAELLLAAPELNGCVAQQLYRFAIGRSKLDDGDLRFVSTLSDGIGTKPFADVLVDLVSSDGFRARRQTD